MPSVLANGLTIEVQEFGSVGDPPVLLIMGLGAQMIVWPEEICRLLADAGNRVVRFDNRDVGLSTWLDEAETPDMAALFGAAIEGKDIEAPYTRIWRPMLLVCLML